MNPLELLEADFVTIVDSIPDAVVIVDHEGRIALANAQTERIFGYAAPELHGQRVEMLIPSRFRPEHPEHRRSFSDSPRVRPMGSGLELFGLRKNGSEFPVEISLSPVKARGGAMVIAAIRDVTERTRREEEIRTLNRLLDAETAFRSLVEHAPYGIARAAVEEDHFRTANPALIQMLGCKDEEEVVRLSIARDVYRDPGDRAAHVERIRSGGNLKDWEGEWKRRDGRPLFVRISARRASDQPGADYMDLVAEDITDKRKLEQQFQQSQRLEAVAQLAGGVAHDFNNLLGVITGYSWMLLNDIEFSELRREKIEGILQAAGSAANLTRQLLAVSRKQVMQATVLNLNTVVEELQKMLRRVIGEDIALKTELDPQIGRVKLDRTQIEQVILNLVINARDAMPRGGELRIETSNAHLDEQYAAAHVGVQPGDYVLLGVSDTGTGMDKPTQARVFEPFFTTKEPGKGTGLGLASVYGIVKQSGGHIWLYSEPGAGTSFKIYFPRVDEAPEKATRHVSPASFRGTETVLLVEDHPLLRKMTVEMIRGMGYTVLETEDVEAALQTARNHPGEIQLLVTDVVMPTMNGPALKDQITAVRPAIKTLFISGYSGDVLSQYGEFGAGTGLLQKPYSAEDLGLKMRQLLDRAPGSE